MKSGSTRSKRWKLPKGASYCKRFVPRKIRVPAYRDAAHLLMEIQAKWLSNFRHSKPRGSGKWRLVHGLIGGYEHAWLENDYQVLDPNRDPGRVFLKADYYAQNNINRSVVVRYTYNEMMSNMASHRKYGPWF